MKKIYLKNGIDIKLESNTSFFIIIENEISLAEEATKKILEEARKKEFVCIKKINVKENKKNFEYFNTQNFFYKKKIVLVSFSNKDIFNNLTKLIEKIKKTKNQKIVVIIKLIKIKNFKYVNKILQLIKKYILINCTANSNKDVINWIDYNAKKNKTKITKNAKNLLYYHYKNNITKLTQIILQFKFIFKNKKINTKKIEKIMCNNQNFTYKELVHIFFTKNIKKTIQIINTIYKEKYNIEKIIKQIHIKLLTIIYLRKEKKYEMKSKKNIKINISIERMYKIIRYITIIEIKIKKNININFWKQLKILLLIITMK
ncbi:hypothetical protein RJI84_01475 [Buchnera aphidicola (Chaitoregma tattakana)]|uniref:hypothetical protein n=1 Tax=Buchnera aphidicola TaxID=9 RepID=UPI0031B7EFCF